MQKRKQHGKEAQYLVVWEFYIRRAKRRAFEQAYGLRGEWAQLFREGARFIRTELVRDAQIPNRYLTLDYWKSFDHYEKFKKQNRARYQMIDNKCEALTVKEAEIGGFTYIS